jgi:hypothetical protein
MERQIAEITPETCGAICHWMERALLRLGVPPTYVTYCAEYIPTVTGRMVLCTRAFRDLRERSATAPCSPSQYRATFKSGML